MVGALEGSGLPNMTTAPETDTLLLDDEDQDEPQPRFAVQRAMAAHIGGLAERMLLNRARSEGEAHRRSSGEFEPLED